LVKIRIFFILGIFIFLFFPYLWSDQTLVAKKVKEMPVVDGEDKDSCWKEAKEIVTLDKIAKIGVRLKAVYDDKDICFLVKFPDKDESRTHKSWVWDEERDIYVVGNDREDVFQFVWSMKEKPVDLSIYADNSYKADVWYWKAFRTDPTGFADDRILYLSEEETEEATKLKSESGKDMYLLRRGDQGEPAYQSKIYGEYQGDVVPRFVRRTPSGSRSDIKAKGKWKDGFWTIEFCRALKTNHNDDIQFDINKEYIFGISRYEIAGRDIDLTLTQPLYGCGDVGEELKLIFEKSKK
jgi:hypothetical protein